MLVIIPSCFVPMALPWTLSRGCCFVPDTWVFRPVYLLRVLQAEPPVLLCNVPSPVTGRPVSFPSPLIPQPGRLVLHMM